MRKEINRMSEVQILKVESREEMGKGAARAIRRAGRVPGVVYGNKQETDLISLDPAELKRNLHKTGFFATLFDLKMGNKTVRVLPKDVQLHPVTDIPLHADFMRISKNSKIHVNVPVQFINETQSPGIKRGGVLNIVLHQIELICSPENIPNVITIDLSGLEIGDSIHISKIKLDKNVIPAIADRDFTIATIAAPSALKGDAEADKATADQAAAASAASTAAPDAGTAKPAGEKK